MKYLKKLHGTLFAARKSVLSSLVWNISEAVARRFSSKTFLNILQESQENTFARVFFNKIADFSLQLKLDSGTGVFLWTVENI